MVGRLRRALTPALVLAVLAVPVSAVAQATVDTVGMRAGAAHLHPVVGLFGGRFDVDGGPRLDVLGARGGLGFGDLFRVTGFYWRSVDTGERELLDGRGWGGEAQLNLNAGFGLTPFVTAGLGRVRVDTLADRTAIILGGGLMIPLGPVQLNVGARDYILGVSALDSDADETTHNWLFSAGLSASVGRTRGREPVTVARAPAAVVREVAPGVIDTVRVDAAGEPVELPLRNYQSDRQIQVPIPIEGSITLHYGPARAAEARAPAAAAVQAPAAAIPQEVQPQPAPVLSEAAMQRIIDGTVAALLPRLEARDAQRQDRLRADIDAALSTQREAVRQLVQQEVDRLALAPRVAPQAPGTPVAPVAAPPDHLEAELQRAAERLATARAELARIEAAAPVAPIQPQAADPQAADPPATDSPATEPPTTQPPPGRDLRPALVDLAARHPAMLTTAELERGPALVVADIAFDGDSALPDERTRAVLASVASVLRAAPDRPVFVQGHADAATPEVRSQQLSELRAEVVRSLLVQAGVQATRVHAIGFGAGRPVATNDTAAGRALNRRVEIVIGESQGIGGMQ